MSMSTPIQGAELSPEDPKFYAPPRWRSGAVAAPPIQPSLGESEVPSQVAADSTTTQYEMRFCRQKAIECEEEAKRMPSSNLPNNGASWRTGLNVHHQVTDGGAQAGLDKRGRGSNRDTLAERLKSLAPFQSLSTHG
jgi:hypothetical protein